MITYKVITNDVTLKYPTKGGLSEEEADDYYNMLLSLGFKNIEILLEGAPKFISFQKTHMWTLKYRLDGDKESHFFDCELPICGRNIFEVLETSKQFLPNGSLILGLTVKEE